MPHDTRRRDSIVGYGHGEHSATPRARSVSVSMPAHAFLASDLICPCMCSACPPLHSVRISPDVRLAVETLLLIMGDAPGPARLLASFQTLAKWLAPHELKVVIMSLFTDSRSIGRRRHGSRSSGGAASGSAMTDTGTNAANAPLSSSVALEEPSYGSDEASDADRRSDAVSVMEHGDAVARRVGGVVVR
jgi:hypothetical protein